MSQIGGQSALDHVKDVALTASSDRPFRSWIVLPNSACITSHGQVCVIATSIVLT